MAMASCWSELPVDLFGSIVGRLPFVDHGRISCVCVSWRSAVRSNNFRPLPELPWLMLPPLRSNNNAKFPDEVPQGPMTFRFLSIHDNKIYYVPLPYPLLQTRVIFGSSMGWLIATDERSKLHLWNPFTGSQISLPSFRNLPSLNPFTGSQITLPSFRPLPSMYPTIWGSVGRQNQWAFTADESSCYRYVKAIFAPSSHSSGDYTVVLIYNPNQRLAFAKSGDDSWTTLQEPYGGFRDVTHHKGKFYTLDCHGNVAAWDLDDPWPKSKFPAPTPTGYVFDHHVSFLVESSSGDLLHVHRSGGRFLYEAIFEVFKLDPTANDWVRVMSSCEVLRFDMSGDEFKIFKMDLNENQWVGIDGFCDEALVLGCVYSTSFSHRFLQDLYDGDISLYKSSLPIWIKPSMFCKSTRCL